MTYRERQRLADIQAAIDAIRSHLQRGDLSDGLIFDAVRIRLLEIGEAAKTLPDDLLATQPSIPWRQIARVRDHLAHRYFDTAHAILQATVDEDLPDLERAGRALAVPWRKKIRTRSPVRHDLTHSRLNCRRMTRACTRDGGINETLAGLTWLDEDDPADGGAGQEHGFPGPLDDLIRDVRTAAGQKELRQLLSGARLGQPVLVHPGTATRMARPYAWLLDRVDDDGIKLTGVGYLPPVHVAAAVSPWLRRHLLPAASTQRAGRRPSAACCSWSPAISLACADDTPVRKSLQD